MIAQLDLGSAALEPLPARQQVAAIVLSVGLLLLVLELVRRRKLREEYSLLWVATSTAVVALAVLGHPLVWLSKAVGAANPVSTLFLASVLFLILVALQFSIRLSKLTYRNKSLSQRLALLEEQVRQLEGKGVATAGKGAGSQRATSNVEVEGERRRKGGAA